MRDKKVQQRRKSRVVEDSDSDSEEGGQQKHKGHQQQEGPLQQGQHLNGKKKKAKVHAPNKEKSKQTPVPALQVATNGHVDNKQQAGQNGAHNIWWFRCRRLLLCCLENDHMDVIAGATATWSPGEVMDMVKDWAPHKFAAAFAEAGPERLAALLQGCSSSFASSACESWPPEQLSEVLPLLKTKTARQILRSLYFKSEDPYLTRGEAHTILMAFPPAKRDKLCSKLSHTLVDKVLGADPDDDDDDSRGDDVWMDGYNGGDGSGDGDDSYESSFVVDDDEVEEGGQGDSEEEEEEEYDDRAAMSGRKGKRKRVVSDDEEEEVQEHQISSQKKSKKKQKGGGSSKAGQQQLDNSSKAQARSKSRSRSKGGQEEKSRRGTGSSKKSRQR